MSALTACALSPRASAAGHVSSSSPPPRRDYAALFERGRNGGAPPLFLAPMEGLGDRRLRRALAFSTGGFDEACREFTRVPGVLSQGANPEKLLRGILGNVGCNRHPVVVRFYVSDNRGHPSRSWVFFVLLLAKKCAFNHAIFEKQRSETS